MKLAWPSTDESFPENIEPFTDQRCASVDKSNIGPVAFNVEISGTGARANVVALLHPSFSPANQRHRRSTAFVGAKPEVEMIRRALG